jgi:hypothetical protein
MISLEIDKKTNDPAIAVLDLSRPLAAKLGSLSLNLGVVQGAESGVTLAPRPQQVLPRKGAA